VALSLIGLFWITPNAPEVEESMHALRSELVLQDGRLFLIGQTNSFTGLMLEYYEDHSLKSRSMVSNGLLHGLSEGWHTNGVPAVCEHFQAGTSHGPRTKWYASGRILSEANIEDGQLHGTFRRWHENGTLSEQIEMRHGQPEGLSLAYYPSGCLKAKATLQNGKLLTQKFWPDGEVQGNFASLTNTE
jgi:antitoxin component YwqK of YwqJK toxin-antitoxin module